MKDEGGNIILVKMTQLLKVNETQDAVPIDAIKEASAVNSKQRKLKRAGVNDEDILATKRDRKRNQKYID